MEKNSKYSLFSNIGYALKNIWNWDKAFYLFFIPSIPFAIVLPLAGIYFPKIIIDAIQTKQSINHVFLLISIYFALLFIFSLINQFCESRLGMRQYNFSTMYQHNIIEKFMRTDFCNTDNPKLNILYSHAMRDASSGQCAPEVIWRSLLSFIINVLGVFTYGTIISIMSPVILFVLIFSAVVTYCVSRWLRNYNEKNKDKWAVIDRKIGYLSDFSSKFEYAKDIRIYSMSGWLTGLLEGFQKEKLSWVKKVSLRSFCGSIIGAMLTLLRDGIAYALLISMFLANRIGIGDFVFFFGVIVGFSIWLNSIVNNVSDLVGLSVRINYYRDYFDIKEIYNHGKGCDLPTENEFPLDIEFCNVSYKYPSDDDEDEKYALKNINLFINKGERIAVVGQNGAGKTTLIKLLCGFYFPTEGLIKVNGKSILEFNIEDYYTLFSAVFQDIHLIPVTIAEFISSNDSVINYEKARKALMSAGLYEKIMSLSNGLNSRLMKGVFDDSIDLSGGEKQKLMLARALYKNAPIIVLDEPTAALDPIAENELYLQYGDLTKNKTSIYVSHRLASTRFCDRIIFIDNGKIAEVGTHDELMKLGGEYAYMFDIQSQFYKQGAINV